MVIQTSTDKWVLWEQIITMLTISTVVILCIFFIIPIFIGVIVNVMIDDMPSYQEVGNTFHDTIGRMFHINLEALFFSVVAAVIAGLLQIAILCGMFLFG